jgi:hypothetical protein
MRAGGVRGLLIYCSDYHCSHWTAITADQWADDLRLSDIEPRFTCQACGREGADVRPDFHWEADARSARIPALVDHATPMAREAMAALAALTLVPASANATDNLLLEAALFVALSPTLVTPSYTVDSARRETFLHACFVSFVALFRRGPRIGHASC